jgi:hypothetical protein
VNHLRDYCDRPSPQRPRRRGAAHQRHARRLEHAARVDAVTAGLDLVDEGFTWSETAGLFAVAPRTLRAWRQIVRPSPRDPPPRGRPVVRSARDRRQAVVHRLDEFGPALGIPALRAAFPAMPRAELADLLGRYRRVWRARHYEPLRVLHWQRPGHVWAVDFTGPRPGIEGPSPYLLAVRDLASGRQLLWWPCAEATAAHAVAALATLFAHHGAPLVLKADNGSPFAARRTRQLAHDCGVEMLFSPPGTPRYNGAIEAGIGSLTTRTEQHAARHGRPGAWTFDDLEAARREANATSRPRGAAHTSPDEAWVQRQRLTPERRTLFRHEVHRQRIAIDAQGGPDATPPTDRDERARDRQAIRRALETLGELTYTRRRIPLPLRKNKVASIM